MKGLCIEQHTVCAPTAAAFALLLPAAVPCCDCGGAVVAVTSVAAGAEGAGAAAKEARPLKLSVPRAGSACVVEC